MSPMGLNAPRGVKKELKLVWATASGIGFVISAVQTKSDQSTDANRYKQHRNNCHNSFISIDCCNEISD